MTDLGPQKQPHSLNQVQAQTRCVVKDLQLLVTHQRQMTDEQLRYMADRFTKDNPYLDEIMRRKVMEITLGGPQPECRLFL